MIRPRAFDGTNAITCADYVLPKSQRNYRQGIANEPLQFKSWTPRTPITNTLQSTWRREI
jgi:hypothetical protein